MKYVGVVLEGGVVEGISIFPTENEVFAWAEKGVKSFALDVESGDRDYALFAVDRPTEQLLSNATVEAWLAEAEDEADEEEATGYDPIGGGGGHDRSDLPYGQGGGGD